MKTIVIGRTRKGVVIVDDQDYVRISKLKLFVTTQGYVGYEGHQLHGKRPRRYLLHNLLVGKHSSKEVDHINGNKLDNRRENLRVTTHHVNQVNRHRQSDRNTSGVRGVYFKPSDSRIKPWWAHICVNRKHLALGNFATIEEATLARQYAELKYYGELCPIPGREFKEWGGMGC